MAELQTNYTSDLISGYPGMVANGETSNRISRTIDDAGGIAFGRAAFRGPAEHTCTATPTAGMLLGVTIAHEALGLLAGQAEDVFPRYANVPIMTLGVIWVTAGATVARGDQAYVTPAGAFTNVASGNVIMPDWFFDTAGASGALVKLAKR